MNIKIFSPDFILRGSIDSATSVQLTRKLRRPGNFEIHIHPDDSYATALAINNMVMFDNDENKCGIIEYVEHDISPRGQNMIVRGRTLEQLVCNVITVPKQTADGKYEAWDQITASPSVVMWYYVYQNRKIAQNSDRNIPNLLCWGYGGYAPKISWQARFEPLDSVLEGICNQSGLGYRVSLDIYNKGFLFSVIEGWDRTATQPLFEPRIVFAPEFGNVKSMSYVQSHITSANSAYAGGQGSGATRSFAQINGQSGFYRRETFLDCGGADDAKLADSATAKLASKAPIVSLTADVTNSPFVFEEDYFLGDYVTVRYKERKISMSMQVTQVTQTYEAGKNTLAVTFGSGTQSQFAYMAGASRQAVR